jgi:hypothetical protein
LNRERSGVFYRIAEMTPAKPSCSIILFFLANLLLAGCRSTTTPVAPEPDASLRVGSLRCEYRQNPLGLD